MMDWKNIILLIVAGLNLGSALMVYFLNPKNRINIYYSAFVFWVSVWIFGLATFRWMQTENAMGLLVFVYYAAAGLIPVFFYLFSIYFPYQKRILTTKTKILVWLGAIIIVIDVLPWFLINDLILSPPDNILVLNLPSNIIYTIIFLAFTIAAFKNLIEKYRDSDGFHRIQLKCLIYGGGIAFFFGMFFDLFYPLFGNYKMIWLGPYFTVVLLVFISYLLFFYSRR